MREFLDSLKVQLRVIYALMMREIITRYGRKNVGFLWLFLEPLILIVGVVILWGYVVHRDAHGFPIAAFIYTGWAANKLWLTAASKAMAGLGANSALLYHRNVKPIDIVLSRILLEVLAMTGVFMILGFVFVMSHLMNHPFSYFHIVVGWYLMVWLAFSFSFFITSLNLLIGDLLQKVWGPISLGLFISSGTFFLVEWLPQEFRDLVLLLPSVHNLEMIRYGFFGDLMHPYYDISYSISFNLFLTFFGLLLFRMSLRNLQME